jgi:hypothetical protein
MFRRRKRKNQTANATQAESPPPDRGLNIDESPSATITTYEEKKRSPVLSDAFKGAIEKAADRLRTEMASEGRIKPMAFFLHADGTMKTVSLSVKDEYQKEGLIRRIQEKVLAENISTVIVLTEIDGEHEMVLSGVSSGMRGSASIDYSFDNTTKTVTSWKITWLNRPLQNVFLDGIFEKKD